ncbi:MAG: hypothetical protein D6725_06480 [Planctomycetota bacterium]|nr:MAG: hypothetical protein D6725_06480 [Planctomycetota bacterium]
MVPPENNRCKTGHAIVAVVTVSVAATAPYRLADSTGHTDQFPCRRVQLSGYRLLVVDERADRRGAVRRATTKKTAFPRHPRASLFDEGIPKGRFGWRSPEQFSEERKGEPQWRKNSRWLNLKR